MSPSDEEIKKCKGPTKGKNKVVENGDGCVDVLSEVAMNNAYLICHNVQDLMYFRGFYWEGAEKKGKGKKKKR